jgi:flagellar biosynthesis/type III secretory pathway protein FliH
MAKKSSKNQPKWPSTADFDNVALPTVTTTNQPASSSFLNFITLATIEDIKKFLKLAATTHEGENLVYLWKRAYEDGIENGRKSLLQDLGKEMEEKFEEGVERGMNLGREQGYTSYYTMAKEAFDKIIKAVNRV